MSEHQEQSLLFQWAELATPKHPELGLLFAIPNFAGHHGSQIARLRSGARAKREGRKKGVPDVCLPISRGGFHSLYLELKAGKGRASPEQKAWILALNDQGHRAKVCVGWEAARDAITEYLALAAA